MGLVRPRLAASLVSLLCLGGVLEEPPERGVGPGEVPRTEPPPGVAPIPPLVLVVEGASGPPELGCAEALGEAPPTRPARPDVPPPPRDPTERPDPATMPQVVVDRVETSLAALPGVVPEDLPLQPLEGPPEVLAAIAAVFSRAQQGERIRVSFFGASHTSCDWWSGHLRRLLQRRWGDAGHGFMLPARLYQGFRGADVNLCATPGWQADWAGRRDGHHDGLLGFAGMSVSSSDPHDFGWLETTHTNPEGRRVAWYDVYTLGQPGGGTLRLVVDEAPPLTRSTAASEPTLQRTRIEVPDGGHRLVLSPAGDGEVRIFGVSMERPGPGVIVDTMGIRGQEARSWLSWEPEQAASGLASLAPDLVVLAYGTNEANDAGYELERYREDLDAVLRRLRRGAPDAPCVLVGPSDRFARTGEGQFAIWERTADFAQVQREVAPEHGCAFWDWQQASGGPGSQIAWHHLEPALAAPDGIHFTKAGYELSAERFLDALDAAGDPPVQEPVAP